LCIALLFTHHLHFLLYLPAIASIVLLRYRAAGKCDYRFAGWFVAVALINVAIFFYLASIVRPPVAPVQFLEALRARALGPVEPGVLKMWYSTLQQEVSATLSALPGNAKRFPVYAALLLLHAPLFSYFTRLVRELANRTDRLFVLACSAGITAGYLVIFVVVLDYARWVSNWAVCMMLVTFASRMLPSRGAPMTPIPPTSRNAALAWAVTLIPRVGITYPF
jgi:hypothetical protein